MECTRNFLSFSLIPWWSSTSALPFVCNLFRAWLILLKEENQSSVMHCCIKSPLGQHLLYLRLTHGDVLWPCDNDPQLRSDTIITLRLITTFDPRFEWYLSVEWKIKTNWVEMVTLPVPAESPFGQPSMWLLPSLSLPLSFFFFLNTQSDWGAAARSALNPLTRRLSTEGSEHLEAEKALNKWWKMLITFLRRHPHIHNVYCTALFLLIIDAQSLLEFFFVYVFVFY